MALFRNWTVDETFEENGLILNVPESVYRALPYVNWSRLKLAEKSQAHYLAGANISPETSKRGIDLHALTLEPLRFEEEYAIMPDFHLDPGNVTKNGEQSSNSNTVYAKKARAEFKKLNPNKQFVSESWYGETQQKLHWLHENDCAREILLGNGHTEVVALWHDELSGIRCKSKLDRIFSRKRYIGADIKGTEDASKFLWAIRRYEYHGQAAFYRDALNQCCGQTGGPFYFIPIEHKKPFCCMCAKLSDELLEEGQALYRGLLSRIASWDDKIFGYQNPDEFGYNHERTQENEQIKSRSRHSESG